MDIKKTGCHRTKGRLLAFWVTCLTLCVIGLTAFTEPQSATTFDIVLTGGRVMDPESGLDAVRNVGINGNRIAAISARLLRGKQTVDVSGLVVAPGFIDLHAHGQDLKSNQMQVRDGVTTALEMESGAFPIAATYAARAARRECRVIWGIWRQRRPRHTQTNSRLGNMKRLQWRKPRA